MTELSKEMQQPSEGPEKKQNASVGSHVPAEKHQRSKVLIIFTLILAILGIAWFFVWLLYLQFHMSTDDAYANGSMVNINSAIDGSVIAFYADNTDLVVQGQLLVKLDPTYYQVVYEQSLADLAAQTLHVKELYDAVFVNQSDVSIKKVLLSKSQFDHENRSQLIASKAVSNEVYIHSRDDLTIAENELKKAEFQLKTSQDVVGNTTLEMHPLIEEKKAEVKKAYYNLKHCEIYSPITGYVAMRAVNVGQSVTRTTDLMAIIPTDYVWVDANYKETQLRNMRVGQSATVWFDLYGSDVIFEGKVIGIASGSGSLFSLIPPQNATGNWIKIVQRLPVRISLDPEIVKKYPVRLGISAEVDVDITDLDLPRLREVPSTAPVTTTSVYDVNMEEINQVIDRIIQTNLAVE